MLKFNNRVLNYNTRWLNEGSQPGPSVPSYTIRLRYTDGVTPTFNSGTAVQVSSSPNIWDLTYLRPVWASLLTGHTDLLEVIYANTNGVTNMRGMFYNCSSLTSVPLFDTSHVSNMTDMLRGCSSLTTVPLFNTSNVRNMSYMLYNCSSLTTVPLFNTSNVTDMTSMFDNCVNVESGALVLYQRASTQTNPPTEHERTFRNCGSNTTTGAAELAQIPSDWK